MAWHGGAHDDVMSCWQLGSFPSPLLWLVALWPVAFPLCPLRNDGADDPCCPDISSAPGGAFRPAPSSSPPRFGNGPEHPEPGEDIPMEGPSSTTYEAQRPPA